MIKIDIYGLAALVVSLAIPGAVYLLLISM